MMRRGICIEFWYGNLKPIAHAIFAFEPARACGAHALTGMFGKCFLDLGPPLPGLGGSVETALWCVE
ncbi:unnamed protein product [Prunus brigantina]